MSLLIASRSPLKLRGLLGIVAELRTTVTRVAVAQGASDTLAQLRTRPPEVLVMDEAIGRELQAMQPGPPLPRTLLLGAHRHAGLLPGQRVPPACGFAGETEDTDALRAMLRHLACCDRAQPDRRSCRPCPISSTLRRPSLPLSAREQQVFERIGRGEGANAIARALSISVKTVESHRASIKLKLGLGSAHDLVRAAYRWEQGDFDSPSAG